MQILNNRWYLSESDQLISKSSVVLDPKHGDQDCLICDARSTGPGVSNSPNLSFAFGRHFLNFKIGE